MSFYENFNFSKGLDYKALTDGQHDPLDILDPFLNADNVSTIAKLASVIPNQVYFSCHTLYTD